MPATPTDPKPAGRAWLLGTSLGDVEPCDEPGGWPEFTLTLRFYVSSADPSVIEQARQRVFGQIHRDLDLGAA